MPTRRKAVKVPKQKPSRAGASVSVPAGSTAVMPGGHADRASANPATAVPTAGLEGVGVFPDETLESAAEVLDPAIEAASAGATAGAMRAAGAAGSAGAPGSTGIPGSATDASTYSRKNASSITSSRKARIRRKDNRKMIIGTAIAAVIVVVVAIAISWNLWFRFDDVKDFQGTWKVKGEGTEVVITEDKIYLTENLGYDYTLDTDQKHVFFSFNGLEGEGVYRFSDDRNTLTIAEVNVDAKESDDKVNIYTTLVRQTEDDKPVDEKSGKDEADEDDEKESALDILKEAREAREAEQRAAEEAARNPDANAENAEGDESTSDGSYDSDGDGYPDDSSYDDGDDSYDSSDEGYGDRGTNQDYYSGSDSDYDESYE